MVRLAGFKSGDNGRRVMAQSQDNQKVFDALSSAGALYDRYLEISRVAQIPTREEMLTLAMQASVPTNLPLTLEIRTQA